jgi:hypothetical protein
MQAIVDTGPLVALFDRSERHHAWVVNQIAQLDPPLLVCEPVLTEAAYLLGRFAKAHETLFDLLENGALALAFHLQDHAAELRRLMQKYRDTPMSLADACVVRMAEEQERLPVLTLDSDFTVYRRYGRSPIKMLYPG